MKTKIYLTDTCHTIIKTQLIVSGNKHTGYFIIDTGCSENILNKKLFKSFDDNNFKTRTIDTLSQKGNKAVEVQARICIDDTEYVDDYSIMECPEALYAKTKVVIFGILGIRFLVNNNIIINYDEGEIRTASEEDERTELLFKNKCPFAYGLIHIGLPTIGISNGLNDQVALTLVDTGSNVNMICGNAIKEYGFNHHIVESENDLTDINNKRRVEMCTLEYHLLYTRDEEIHFKQFNEVFNILDDKTDILDGDGEKPIEAIIGNVFLFNNNCIINCGKGYIYSRDWE